MHALTPLAAAGGFPQPASFFSEGDDNGDGIGGIGGGDGGGAERAGQACTRSSLSVSQSHSPSLSLALFSFRQYCFRQYV